MQAFLRSIQVITILCASLTLIFVWLYIVSNESGHTAANPEIISGPFVPVFAVGILTTFITTAYRGLAIALIVLGIAGLLIGPFLTWQGILTQYDQWARRGMPERNPQTIFLISSYMITAFGWALAGEWASTKLTTNARKREAS